MKNTILNLENAHELSKNEQKLIKGGKGKKKCLGDGSSIIVNGQVVCCYVPATDSYRC